MFSSNRRFSFCFQACDGAATAVKFGPPGTNINERLVQSYGHVKYACRRSLPSSTYIKVPHPQYSNSPQDRKVFEVSIRYELHANLLRKTDSGLKSLAQCVSGITILDDSTGSQPPTCVLDFGSEYRLCRQMSLRGDGLQSLTDKRLHQARDPFDLVVDAAEPRPLVFSKNHKYATTNIPVWLTLFGPEQQLQGFQSGLNGDVTLDWQLRKSVFCSFKRLRKVPMLSSATSSNKDSPMLQKTTYTDQRTCKYRLSSDSWQQDNSATLLARTTFGPSGLSLKNLRLNQCKQGSNSRETPSVHLEEQSTTQSTTESGPRSPNPLTEVSEGLILPNKRVLTTKIPLSINVSTSSLLKPTSFSTFVAVRWKLRINVGICLGSESQDYDRDKAKRPSAPSSIEHGICECLTANADLEIPIQIIYDSASVDSEESQRDPVNCVAERQSSADTNYTGQEQENEVNEAEEVLPSYAASMRMNNILGW